MRKAGADFGATGHGLTVHRGVCDGWVMSDRWYFPGQEPFLEIDRLRKEAFDAQHFVDETENLTDSELVLAYMAAKTKWGALWNEMHRLWLDYRTDHPMLHKSPVASTA